LSFDVDVYSLYSIAIVIQCSMGRPGCTVMHSDAEATAFTDKKANLQPWLCCSGLNYTLNMPVKDGVTDQAYADSFAPS